MAIYGMSGPLSTLLGEQSAIKWYVLQCCFGPPMTHLARLWVGYPCLICLLISLASIPMITTDV
eukprot:6627494-Lingulodinium_polyedra.AAC.1